VTSHHFKYRQAEQNDLPQLTRVARDSYGAYIPLMSEADVEKFQANLANASMLTNLLSVAKGFVCECEGRVIGMAFLIPSGNPWDIFEAGWSYIRMVGVDPAFQGNGIATTLTTMCIEAARNNGEKTIALHTSEMMPAARHIYEKFGFKILKEIAPRWGQKYWIYTLDLSK
jgi:ribosomal protein S18 acetylase RimI-like enzyme